MTSSLLTNVTFLAAKDAPKTVGGRDRRRRGNRRANERHVVRSGHHCREIVLVRPDVVAALVYPKRWDMFFRGRCVVIFRGRERQKLAKLWMKVMGKAVASRRT